MAEASNVFWHTGKITRAERERILSQKGKVLWFTGLSGSGKSTIANALEAELNAAGVLTYILDGDNLRHGLNRNLGFSLADRCENLRRTGEVAKLMADAGLIVIASLISPLRDDREEVRTLLGDDFIEVYVDCPLAICEGRDPKSLYQKARRGEITNFTGIDSPYEAPENPEIILHTGQETVAECVAKLSRFLDDCGSIGR